jgi:hypothetical protein
MMCGTHAPMLVDLGFEASIFVLVFSAMTLAHLVGIVTWSILDPLDRQLRSTGDDDDSARSERIAKPRWDDE